MSQLILPKNYESMIDLMESQRAIKKIKDYFQQITASTSKGQSYGVITSQRHPLLTTNRQRLTAKHGLSTHIVPTEGFIPSELLFSSL